MYLGEARIGRSDGLVCTALNHLALPRNGMPFHGIRHESSFICRNKNLPLALEKLAQVKRSFYPRWTSIISFQSLLLFIFDFDYDTEWGIQGFAVGRREKGKSERKNPLVGIRLIFNAGKVVDSGMEESFNAFN